MMRLCPACGTRYSDDANFCPMDANKLVDAGEAAAPARSEAAPAAHDTINQAPMVGGHIAIDDEAEAVPTGELRDGVDVQTGEPLEVHLVDARTLPTSTMADRALRELKQLAKVKSGRLLRIVGQGKTDDGRVFIATERPAGVTLEELVADEGPLPVERARAIVLAVGEALAEAQKVGVIHRDLAPRNVIVDGDAIKVTGFGLAEPIDDGSGAAKVFGAPAFLSPEQAEGKPVDQRSNIYSLGALFYYVLTGAPPFAGDGQTPMSIVQQHLHAQPAPPSQRRSGLPTEIDRVVLKALEKSGGRRHLTLRQLLNEVEALATAVAPAPAAAPAPEPRSRVDLGSARTMLISEPPSVVAARAENHASAPVASSNAGGVASHAMADSAATVLEMPAPRVDASARAVMAAAPEAQSAPARAATAAPAPAPAAARPAPAGGKKKGFRETAWFKKGELEEELAKKAAEMSAEDPLAGPAVAEAVVDESALTADDRARLSLKTGRTEIMQAIKPTMVPGDRMSDEEMLAEMDGSRRWMIVAGSVIGVLAVLAAVWFLFLRAPATPAG